MSALMTPGEELFRVMFRMHNSGPQILNGTWKPQAIRRI